MEIFNFNMSDNKEDVINALIDVYYDNPELFEDEAYCHFDVDDLTGDIYVFNNTREAEYACACDYILDDDDNIPEDDIRDCVEYFYNEMIDKAEERTLKAKRNGYFKENYKTIRKLKEAAVNSYDVQGEYDQEWEKSFRLINKECNRFGYTSNVEDEVNDEMYRRVTLSKRNYPSVIVEFYAPYETGLVRIDCTPVIEKYTYGRSKGQLKMRVDDAQDFRDVLTKALELAAVMESNFGNNA